MVEEQKKALLLHFADPHVQVVFETLPPLAEVDYNENDDAYQITLKALDKYFLPRSKVTYEMHIFYQLKQDKDETVDQFISSLI